MPIYIDPAILIGLSMGLNIVAEGVETQSQKEQLQALGCHELQGYLFDPALPLAKLTEKYAYSSEKVASDKS